MYDTKLPSVAAEVQRHTVFDGISENRARLQRLTDRVTTLANRMVGPCEEKNVESLPDPSASGLLGVVEQHNNTCGWLIEQADRALDRIEVYLP